ncbi:MAG: peptide ABC transporter substrate-binding protein [Bdellovibrionota bacterium]
MRKLLLVFCLHLGLFSYADAPASAPPAHQSKVLRVRALGEPQTLDWNRASTWVDAFVIRNLMEGLVSVETNLKAAPALATRWESSKDQRRYTFFLKKNVLWSDGMPLKAAHFVDSWQRLLNPATKSKYASFLFDIESAEEYHRGGVQDFGRVGVKALDDHTLEVRLRAPIAYWHFIPSFYATFPIRKDLIQKEGDAWTNPRKLVNLGPFLFEAQVNGKSITFIRNPRYHGAHGNLEAISFATIHDDRAALKMYQTGQLDFVSKIPSLERERLKERDDFQTWPDLRTIHLRMNTRKGPTRNESLRKAIASAIDRQKLAALFNGSYERGSSLVPPGLLGHSKNGGAAFDLKYAKQSLKESGVNVAQLPPLDLLTISFDDQIITAQFIQEELKKNLGLKVRLHILEPKRYYSPQLNYDDYAMQINFWGADFPDPDNFYSIFLSNSGLNRYKWAHEKYDGLVRRARSLPTEKERLKAYREAENILLEQSVATIPLYYGKIHGLVRKHISGFKPGSMNWWIFRDLSIKNEGR